MSFISTVVSDLKFAVAHPTTVRKELIAAATTVGADATAFSTLVHVSGSTAAGISAVTGVCTFILTFLGQNQSQDAVKAKVAAKLAAKQKTAT